MEEIFDSLIIMDGTTEVWKLLARVGFAIIAGFLLGIESRSRSKDAGIKTHTMLCMTACVLMIISKYGFYELSPFEGIQYDASRVASTIISGLCFMGAGVVFYKKDSIKGLTSAVGMCLTIAIGMCFGSGLLVVGGSVTIAALILQFVLHQDFGILKSNKHILVKARFVLEENYIEQFKKLFNIDKFLTLQITKEEGRQIAEVDFYYTVKISNEEIAEIVKNEPQILMIKFY